MILGFKETFPWGGPTHFREKILAAVDRMIVREEDGKEFVSKKYWGTKYAIQIAGIKPKLHTIREDKHNRWKAGMGIQMVYRGPKYSIKDHFNKGVEELERCVGVQTISIRWFRKPLPPLTGKQISESGSFTSTKECQITIDGKNMNWERLVVLAQNDGFNCVTDFLQWFSEDFSGKIIHFTNFRY